MGAHDVFIRLVGRGFTLTPREDGRLYIAPSYALTDEDRIAIRTHRDELLKLATQAPRHELPEGLVAAVSRLCELRGDEPAHRENVLAELCVLPPEQYDELREMFENEMAHCERAATEAIRRAAGQQGMQSSGNPPPMHRREMTSR